MTTPIEVFVAGLHRSGTSLLTRSLSRHPLMTTFRNTGVPEDEGQHLQTVFPAAKKFGGPGKFAFADAMHLTEESPLATSQNAARLRTEWEQYWDLNRPFRLEKSPPNLLKTRLLQHFFPAAKFIVTLRHPVAVAYATQKWSKNSIDDLVRHWIVAHELFWKDLPYLNSVFLLRYEDFIADPESTMVRIHAFLGLEHVVFQEQVRADINRAYFDRWQRDRHHWLSGFAMKRVIKRYEDRTLRFGYSLLPEVDSHLGIPDWAGSYAGQDRTDERHTALQQTR